ncbi:MAG: NADH-quinone oxidoreductase subunit L [Acidipila sp.]|nr:NADH-quinone oxidoreductase subunit L [Acidipila sp.]
MPLLDHLWIIPALPLLGAALNGLLGSRWPKSVVNAVAAGSTGLAFAAVLKVVQEFSSLPAAAVPWVRAYFPWIVAGKFRVDFALQVDQLTVVMLLVVTGVGWLIHIYSTGYMAHEGGYYRFFAYLNLFMFFMLVLVLAANYVVMFVGWEGVGLCSYLLIGFYFHKKSATDAGKKAFIVNRIGDFGFMLGMFLIFKTFGAFDFATVFQKVAALPVDPLHRFGTLSAIALLLFVGAMGKSAQVPLYVWLPDAMEGPTPVSALIHAATMVTAGVYMVARSNTFYLHSSVAMHLVATIGLMSAFFAATIALVQTDIKRVLAYSTVSQLGYMVLACGLGAFSAGIFHLMTHAFFKALLFLAAGSVIHAMGGEQDLLKMGGLRKKIPWTFWTMLVGTLAIAGFPPFAGFFSKDEILLASLTSPAGGVVTYWIALLTALFTSFYMFRLIFLSFFGSARYDEHSVHVHESPSSMIVPLVILAVLSLTGGWMAAPALLEGGVNHFEAYLSPVFAGIAHLPFETQSVSPPGSEHAYMALAVASSAFGLLVAWLFYIRRPAIPAKLAKFFDTPYNLLLHKYYVDEIYDALVIEPLEWVSTNVLWRGLDAAGIDGAVNGTADLAQDLGGQLRRLQSGNARSYGTWVIVGAVALTTLFLWLVA